MVVPKISVLRLQIGNHVVLPAWLEDHPFIVSDFRIHNEDEIHLIRHLNLQQVGFIADRSTAQPLDAQDIQAKKAIDHEAAKKLQEKLSTQNVQQQELLRQHKQDFLRAQDEHKQRISRMRSIFNKIYIRPALALSEAQAFIQQLLDTLLNTDRSHLHLSEDIDPHDTEFSHITNITALSMLLAKSLETNEEGVFNVGLAAFFHGIGKAQSPDQYKLILTHTPETITETVEQLGSIPQFPEQVLKLVKQHCERCDGTGIPNGLEQKDIEPLAQMIGLVDEFHVMCAAPTTNSANTRTPYMALSTLYAHKKTKFNKEHLELLVKTIGVYPPGSVVRLSNQQIAVVVSLNSDHLLKPVVMVYEPQVKPNRTRLLDLVHDGLAIEQACSVARLSTEEKHYLLPKRSSFFIDPN